MRKTFSLVLATIMMGAFLVMPVKAECSNEEKSNLNKIANDVTITSEFSDEVDESGELLEGGIKPTYKLDTVSIKNITDKVYVVLKESNTNINNTYRFSDSSNGTITLKDYDVSTVKKYTMEVYASDQTSCQDTRLKVKYLTTLVYNPYSQNVICDENKDYEYCKEYISNPVDEDTFYEKVEAYQESNKKDEKEEKGKLLIIILVIIISILVIGGTTTMIISKKKRSR